MPYYHYGDRPQMRFGGGLTPMVKRLIIANVAVFIFQIMLGNASSHAFINFFGLVPASVFRQLRFWQFFTYMFLHGGLWHILINMFVLWMFGSDLEREWGGRKFLRYYFITGIGAGFIHYLSAINSPIPVIGASGAIFGVLVAFGMTFPERIVTLLIFFVFPVSMKAKHLVMLFAVIQLLAYLAYGEAEGVARFAHLGGMLIGYLYLKAGRGGYGELPSWSNLVFRISQWRVRQRARQREAREKEEDIDAILDKISRQGMESLTQREKRILQRKSRT